MTSCNVSKKSFQEGNKEIFLRYRSLIFRDMAGCRISLTQDLQNSFPFTDDAPLSQSAPYRRDENHTDCISLTSDSYCFNPVRGFYLPYSNPRFFQVIFTITIQRELA